MSPATRGDEAGFTLIELMISLALFALISVAGLALVDSVLGVQGRTEIRLDRLADLQRTMLVISSDLEQVAPGDVTGGGPGLIFTRVAPGLGGSPVAVTYALEGGTLVRSVDGQPQALLGGVAGARWRFFDAGWDDRWPVTQDKARWPRAVELELALAGGKGPGGTLRRVVRLPARAREQGT